ncbi:F0F1 ATP synthase subunit delta [Thiotrichales bacterium 19S3-7]|nr:F0F1 ATP synthase subunit delta [Thiotrichales bacterium 19S3-7]MCF6800924.1 F0F1 ATP synthase subunit delta [Thiotrichales bacterium 19S3-11]
MAELYHLARPYAKAAFEYADEKGKLKEWLVLFEVAEKAILCDDLSQYLTHPQISQVQIIQAVISALAIDDQAFINLLVVVAENKRLAIFGAISELYAQFKARKERSVYAVMTSAFEVSDHIAEAMKKKLERKFDAEVKLETQVDPTLIGGAVIQVGDLVIDGSVLGNFRRLKQELLA